MNSCVITNLKSANKYKISSNTTGEHDFILKSMDLLVIGVIYHYKFNNESQYLVVNDNWEPVICSMKEFSKQEEFILLLSIIAYKYGPQKTVDQKIDSIVNKFDKLLNLGDMNKSKLKEALYKVNDSKELHEQFIDARNNYIEKYRLEKDKLVQSGGFLLWMIENALIDRAPAIVSWFVIGIIEIVDIALTIVSAIPGVGTVVDIANIAMSLLRLDFIGFIGSVIELIPVIGIVGAIIKLGGKFIRYLIKGISFMSSRRDDDDDYDDDDDDE